jgi:uncharacterized protein (UPF0297 family)
MDPYDLYNMAEANEEEMEEMKKDALAWLQEKGYTHVLRHGCCVCALIAILLTGNGVFVTSYNMLLALAARDVP